MTTIFNASEFTASKAKPLPIVLLLDTSGSMSGQKITSLNSAVRRMLGTFTKEESLANEFLVSIITFGPAELALSPTPASEVHFQDLPITGMTPLGEAIDLAKQLIEDRERTPSRAYRPLVVLVSDGQPTDSWESKLDDFVTNGRSAKCDRMALGIEEGYTGPGRATLDRFVEGTEHQVFGAQDAGEIHNFFRFVTMSVVTRSLSQDPNAAPKDAALQPPRTGTVAGAGPITPATSAPIASTPEDSYW